MAGVVDGRPSWEQWEDMGRVGYGAARAMWARTSLRPGDVDVAELYDGFTIECVWRLEAMGLCGTGEAGAFVEGGTRIGLSGELPLNTWGGQLSGGRLHAAFGHTAEAVRQLRGEGYPDLKFVSVENGAGWLPFLGEAMDWQWLNVGAHKEYQDRLLPSEYLRRQVYGMYWFEQQSVGSAIDLLADNLMFETTFPHATSLSPGPASESPSPRDVMDGPWPGSPTRSPARYCLQHTASTLYNLDPRRAADSEVARRRLAA